ncbi:MAG: hypothetical protein KatS3mg085_012 [Candidatus Dojkabacteria bacterium]|nr:MAG: hypothetical protein KatS3mg085_012 [Candidatus Dojkabacteria bacterium]
MQDEIRTIFDAINNDDREILIQKFKDYKPEKELPKNLREFSINITNLDIKKEKIIDSSFANLDLSMGACKKDASLRVYFDKKLEKFTFSNYENFVDNLCLKSGILGFIFGESCEDCTFYPLDRYNSLPNVAWEPSDIVYVQEIPGGQSISMKAYNDLIDMFREAQKAGFSMMLNSGYRSYQTQYYVYENWVKVEMSKGYTRSQAEAIASQYSARPGFSEHQLGTTVDIGAVSCSSFTNCNESIWNWLRDNAYKFGFIMSYPPGTQNKTGYIHEPWHYRWIGRDLASEYILYKDQYVLGEWLKLKNVGIL